MLLRKVLLFNVVIYFLVIILILKKIWIKIHFYYVLIMGYMIYNVIYLEVEIQMII